MLNRPLIEAFGKRIRQLRTERNLSQEQLAELTGFHRTSICTVDQSKAHLASQVVDPNLKAKFSELSPPDFDRIKVLLSAD